MPDPNTLNIAGVQIFLFLSETYNSFSEDLGYYEASSDAILPFFLLHTHTPETHPPPPLSFLGHHLFFHQFILTKSAHLPPLTLQSVIPHHDTTSTDLPITYV